MSAKKPTKRAKSIALTKKQQTTYTTEYTCPSCKVTYTGFVDGCHKNMQIYARLVKNT